MNSVFSSITPETPRDPIDSPAPVREPLQRGTGGEYIAADAAHWRRECFIPIATEDLGLEIAKRPLLVEAEFRRVVARVIRHLGKKDQIRRRRFARLYAALDPDREVVRIGATNADDAQRSRMFLALDDILQRAAYRKLEDAEVQASLGVASAWGVRVLVDFGQLKHWAVYSRGDVCGIRPHRHWRRLWRREPTEVPLYQRLVVVFEVQPTAKTLGEVYENNRLHLRLFKNIPKQDVDMLLPSTRPRLGWLDRTKIILPTISSVGMTVFKIARGLLVLAFVGIYGTLALAALVVAAFAYSVRSVFAYLQTKDRLQLSMTRSLYFQKLDSGAGVIWNLCQSAIEQEIEETMVAAAVLMEAERPLTEAEVEERGAEMVSNIAQIDVIFRSKEAIAILVACDLAVRNEQGDLQWVRKETAR